MTAGIIGGVTWVIGVILIVVGATLSIADWNRRRQSQKKEGEFETEELGTAEVLEGLAKLFDALKEYPLGRFMMAFGLVLILIGAIVSTAGAIAA